MPGIYELVHGSDVSYVTADGKYVFSGDLYRGHRQGRVPQPDRGAAPRDRGDAVGRAAKRVAAAGIADAGVRAGDAKHTITVFTDIDCPWCRKLHAQVADYNKLGIRVRYLFYPRTGPDTESWYKAEAVWCAKDRNKAMTQAKLDQPIDDEATAPIRRWRVTTRWARDFGLKGTPGIVLETGELVPGYLGPKDLLARIDSSVALAAAAAK